jgi:hypothetical protein
MATMFYEYSVHDASPRFAKRPKSTEAALKNAKRNYKRAVTLLEVVRETARKASSEANGRPAEEPPRDQEYLNLKPPRR